MKKIAYISLSILLFAGCGINKQVKNLKAFEDCRYEITSADSLYIANVKVTDLVNNGGFDFSKTPRIALALLRKDVPLSGKINMLIRNPTADLAAVNQFEYKILFKNAELANGLVDQPISVQPNGEARVPIKINSNIYGLLSDSKTQDAIVDFISSAKEGKEEKKGIVTIKIKPTIGFGGKKIKYPGYITIDKEVSSKILL